MDNKTKALITEHKSLTTLLKINTELIKNAEISDNDSAIEFANIVVKNNGYKLVLKALITQLNNRGIHYVDGHYVEEVDTETFTDNGSSNEENKD